MTTHTRHWRSLILRAYWDGDEEPAIEVPVGDFFGQGWCTFAQLSSAVIAVNPHGGFNSYWPMPFARSARITVENIGPERATLYYQVTYEIDVDVAGSGYLHAQFHRSNPLPRGATHPILDTVPGRGRYAGTYLAWGVNNPGWWGEGEIKFYMDGDTDYPTICGTGTEDYFGGAWNFEHPQGQYGVYTTPFLGLPQVIKPDGLYQSQQRFGMYRWHIQDPIRFADDLKVTIQALGWRSRMEDKMRYLPLQDDIASTSFWYQSEPHASFPAIGEVNDLEVGSGGRGAAAPGRTLGDHPTLGGPITVRAGRFGPYVNNGKINATLPKSVDPEALTLAEAVALIDAKAAASPAKPTKARATRKSAGANGEEAPAKTTGKTTGKAAAKKSAGTKTAAAKAAPKKAPATKAAAAKTRAAKGGGAADGAGETADE